MPRHAPLLAVPGVFTLLVVLVAIPGRAPADDSDRAALLKSFNTLQGTANKKLEGAVKKELLDDDKGGKIVLPKTFHNSIPTVKTQFGDSRFMVKLWAELFPSGDKVALTEYKWGRREQFNLCLETSVPVRLGVYYLPREGEVKRFLPTATDPNWKVLTPGVHRISPRMRTYDDLMPEELTVYLFADGAPENPQPNVGGDGDLTLGDRDSYLTELDEAAKKSQKVGATFRGLETPPKVTSANVDEVALIGVSTGSRGSAKITFTKQK